MAEPGAPPKSRGLRALHEWKFFSPAALDELQSFGHERRIMLKVRLTLGTGAFLVVAPVAYLWINGHSLFPENEPTTLGLVRVLAAGLTFLLGFGFLLAAAGYFQDQRKGPSPQ